MGEVRIMPERMRGYYWIFFVLSVLLCTGDSFCSAFSLIQLQLFEERELGIFQNGNDKLVMWFRTILVYI